jgi:hypothetical protein
MSMSDLHSWIGPKDFFLFVAAAVTWQLELHQPDRHDDQRYDDDRLTTRLTTCPPPGQPEKPTGLSLSMNGQGFLLREKSASATPGLFLADAPDVMR